MATALAPDVIILDEILSVGDVNFQKKCIHRMASFINDRERCIIIVGHNIRQVQRISSKMVMLDNGEIAADGEPVEVTKHFFQSIDKRESRDNLCFDNRSIVTTGDIMIDDVTFVDQADNTVQNVVMGEDLAVRICFTVINPVCEIEIALGIDGPDQVNVATESSGREKLINFDRGHYIFYFKFIKPNLLPGEYSLRLFFHHTLGVNLISGSDVARFCVSAGGRNQVNLSTCGFVKLLTSWDIKRC